MSTPDPTDTILCVIPTHQRDTTLARALESVEAQTRRADAVVVVDDVGSASTRAVVERFAAALPVTYLDATGRGGSAGASRNLGAEAVAHTPLIAFLDDDDYWEPGFLERCAERIAVGDVELVAAWSALESGGRRLPHAWHAEPVDDAGGILAANPGVTGSNLLVRRAAFDRVDGFDAGQWVFNDLDFLIRYLDAGGRFAVLREDLVVQTAEPGEHLSSRSDRRAAGIERYIRKHRHRLGRAQHRVLLRQAAVARLHPGQRPLGRLRYGAAALLHSSPRDVGRAVWMRLRRDPSYG